MVLLPPPAGTFVHLFQEAHLGFLFCNIKMTYQGTLDMLTWQMSLLALLACRQVVAVTLNMRTVLG